MENETILQWVEAAENLRMAKEYELLLRNQICDFILDGKVKGSKTAIINGIYKMAATAKVNDSVDAELLQAMWKDLSPAEKSSIKFKPALIAKVYKTLDGKSNIHRAISSKPGTPSLELKQVIKI